jgi:hypothetical protein
LVFDPDVEVTIAYTGKMRCKPAFRPRTAIARYLYTTFSALWNELALRVGADEPETMNALAYDLHRIIRSNRCSLRPVPRRSHPMIGAHRAGISGFRCWGRDR